MSHKPLNIEIQYSWKLDWICNNLKQKNILNYFIIGKQTETELAFKKQTPIMER